MGYNGILVEAMEGHIGGRGGKVVQRSVENEQIDRHVGDNASDIYALGGCRFEYEKGSESSCEERGGSMRNLINSTIKFLNR